MTYTLDALSRKGEFLEIFRGNSMEIKRAIKPAFIYAHSLLCIMYTEKKVREIMRAEPYKT